MEYTSKFSPVSLYDIPGLEQWLEEMANQGLFPERIGGSGRVIFREGGQPGTRFRLEPAAATSEPPQAQLDLYREAGWEFACRVPNLFYLFYTLDPAAPELHTDPETRGQGLDRLARKIRWAKLFLLFYFPVLPLLILLPQFLMVSKYDSQPALGAQLFVALLRLGHPIFFLLLVGYILLTILQIRQLQGLLTLHRNLKEGLPPPPSPGPKKWMSLYHGVTLAALFPLLVYSVFFRNFPTETTLNGFRQPYISLEQIESVTITPDRDDCRAKEELSLLAPVWYTVEQRGKFYKEDVPREMGFSIDFNEEMRHYAPDLEMTYLELTIPAMARPVAKSVMDSMRLINLYWLYEEASHPGADFVLLARATTKPYQMAALGKGGKVAVFRYGGSEDLAEHLSILVDMVQ